MDDVEVAAESAELPGSRQLPDQRHTQTVSSRGEGHVLFGVGVAGVAAALGPPVIPGHHDQIPDDGCLPVVTGLHPALQFLRAEAGLTPPRATFFPSSQSDLFPECIFSPIWQPSSDHSTMIVLSG
jgi:hypothetical protein